MHLLFFRYSPLTPPLSPRRRGEREKSLSEARVRLEFMPISLSPTGGEGRGEEEKLFIIYW